MRFATYLLLGLGLILNAAPTAVAQQPDAATLKIITDSGLGSTIGQDLVVAIVTNDPTYGETAGKLKKALDKVLAENPATGGRAEQIATLRALVDEGLNTIIDGLAANPAARTSWVNAHRELEAVITRDLMTVAADKQGELVDGIYKTVSVSLGKLARLKATRDEAPAPTSIVPTSFWMDSAIKSGLYRFDQRIQESSEAFAKVLDGIAKKTDSSITGLALVAELNQEIKTFLDKIRSERTDRQYRGWRNFAIRWTNELTAANRDPARGFDFANANHVREACKQAAVQVRRIGKEIEEQHQVAADTGGIQPGSSPAAGAGVSTLSGPPHHARVMGRINRRHLRKMGRIQARY